MAKKKKKPSLNSNFPNNATGRRNYKNKKENEQNDKFLNSSFEKLVDLFPSISPSVLTLYFNELKRIHFLIFIKLNRIY